MNPLAVATVSNQVDKPNSRIGRMLDREAANIQAFRRKISTVVTYTLVGGVTFIAGRAVYKASAKSKWEKRASQGDINAQAAIKIYQVLPDKMKEKKGFLSILNPFSGGVIGQSFRRLKNAWATVRSWFVAEDTQSKLLPIADTITNLNITRKAFKAIYGLDFYMILEKALTPQELEQFFKRSSFRPFNPKTSTQYKNKTVRMLVGDTDIYFREDQRWRLLPAKITKEYNIGKSTGRYDQYKPGLRLIEVQGKMPNGQPITGWIDSNRIKLL